MEPIVVILTTLFQDGEFCEQKYQGQLAYRSGFTGVDGFFLRVPRLKGLVSVWKGLSDINQRGIFS